ncbi:MAG: hypothetical protein HYY23_01635 [Verrucomicrobia bacterium]|nr:hypothetical protein [Verrucomicrobiota bacterium]
MNLLYCRFWSGVLLFCWPFAFVLFAQTSFIAPSLDQSFNAGSTFNEFVSVDSIVVQSDGKILLGEPAWSPLVSVQGDGTVKSFMDRDPPTGQRFYRLRVE